MKKLLLSILFTLSVMIMMAQNPPVAVNDTAYTISEATVAIEVLLNDYDPDGDAVEIRTVRNPEHGSKTYNDSIIFYTPELYVGSDSLKYRIRDTNDGINSEWAWVHITVNENPDIPVAVADTASALKLVPTSLFLLENDSDQNGDEIIIYDIDRIGTGYDFEIADDSLSVLFTSGYPLTNDTYMFRYRVIEKNTETHYYSEWDTVRIESIENPDIPVANYDQVNTTGGIPVEIHILDNDENPSGEALRIEITNGPFHGIAEIIDDYVLYTPEFSYAGGDQFYYKIFLEEQPYLYHTAGVSVEVSSNETRPVAINDTAYGDCGGQIEIDVLQNDYDPDGADIEIKDAVVEIQGYVYDVQIVDGKIIYTQLINVNRDVHQFRYRIKEVDHPEAYSDWATVTLILEQNPDYPIAETDYATTIAGLPVEIDVLANDMLNGYNPVLNPLFVGDFGSLLKTDDNKLVFKPYMNSSGLAKLKYFLSGSDTVIYYSHGNIEVEIAPNYSYDSLDINNINAGIHSDGSLFSKYDEIIDYSIGNFESHFEYPKASGKHTIFINSLWIGGVDQNDSLYLAAQRYKQVGYDYQFGPVSNSYEGLEFFSKWSRVWKVSKDDIYYHRHNYWKETYEPVDAIINWPGNGGVANGQAEQLAPYFDRNENGIYEPMLGDYPLIRGDQTVLFIFNDDRMHTETQGGSMQVEIHAMAYGYDEPDDEVLHNTVFVHYDIYNRSDNTYYNTYLGTWSDIDLGYARDDYVGCNVELSSYFGYNGKDYDGSGQPEAYGENPPAQSVTILAGPYMDNDETDNPDGECDYSVNGLNFGDGIVDNERFGMTRFIYHNNSGGAHGDPQWAPDYYGYMNGLWKDQTPVMYGGTGYEPFPGTVGPECRFMFPGASDSCNWGTDGIPPNDGYNQNGKYWTEETANNGEPNPPEDRRGIGVTGPFTFEPGDMQELDLAFSVGQGDDGPQSSVQQLFENLENLFRLVDEGEIIIPTNQLSVDEQESGKASLKVYPNPVKDFVYVKLEGDSYDKFEYKVFNSLGNVVMKGLISANVKNVIGIQKLKQGFYIIKVQKQGVAHSGRFIKM